MSTDDDRRRIIINSIIESPSLTTDDVGKLTQLREKPTSLTWSELRYIAKMTKLVLKGL